MDPNVMTMSDYFAIVKRRKWSLILPFVIIFFIAGIIALALPSIYKSTSTILIEDQDIPADYVTTSVTSYAEQRLQSIHQRIISFTKLQSIINRYNLYPELQDRWAAEEIVDKMREDIILEPISAEVNDRRTGRPSTATIAFTLSYEGKNPNIVQKVANVLTSLFLEENLKQREKQATETSEFLENELEKIKTRLAEIDARMASYKSEHMNELPELLQVNMQSLNNMESTIARFNEQLRNLKEREGYLQTQLVSIPHEEEKTDKTRLAELKVQLVYLQTRFSDQYPDVVKTKNEIAKLEKRVYSKDDKNPSEANRTPDNPAYITLASQLSSTQAEIQSVKQQIKEAGERADEYRKRIANTPRVEETYKAIRIELENTQLKYNDLMRKHMEAKVAQGLEQEKKGERFSLIDPARLPEIPYKPNRLAIMLIGLVLGIGAGVGMASLREFTQQGIYDVTSLAAATSFPVLASIPEIEIPKDTARKKRNLIITIVAIAVLVIVGILLFHFFVMDLNIFWAKLMRKVG